MYETDKIYEWQKEYNVPGEIGYEERYMSKMLGYTSFSKNRADIHINNVLHDKGFALTSIQWHEYCHAELWLTGDNHPGHTSKWYALMARKPLYCLGCVYAQILYKVIK